MGVVAKFHIQSQSVYPGGSQFVLGAVCRGEENKDWAAATPSGSLSVADDFEVIRAVWAERGQPEWSPEILVHIVPDAQGEWMMTKCEFAYGGVAVEFVRKALDHYRFGKLAMTVNARPATRILRETFAASLVAGDAARFAVTFSVPDHASEDIARQ